MDHIQKWCRCHSVWKIEVPEGIILDFFLKSLLHVIEKYFSTTML